jgi:hypothetical protein
LLSFYADLHCHSNCSDGTLAPGELVLHAKKIGLQGLAITDHDTIDAYRTAVPVAKKLGIRLGCGVEFSCQFQGFSIHLLGYDFSLSAPNVHDLCLRHQKRRESRNRAILEKLKAHQMEIAYEELQGGHTIGRPHIAQLMVDKGYVKNIREAFHLYIGEGKKCYVAGEPFLVEEALEVLHGAHGKAFIAHPQLLPDDFPVDELLKLPFDGIECYYARLRKKSWIEIAVGKKWLMSGGSDFHGTVKPEIELGCSGVDKATFDAIFQHELL